MTQIGTIQEYRLTDHARFEMERRQIAEPEVAGVLATPGQVQSIREGREVYQTLIEMGEPPKSYLLRVFVDVDREPPEVVTVYRTSKVERYWRVEA